MHITLICPSSQNISAFGVRSLSAYLKALGHRVAVVMLPLIPKPYRDKKGCLYVKEYRLSERLLEQIISLARESDLVGISFMTHYFSCAVQMTRAIKNSTDVPVIWGGVHPTVCPEDSLKYADIVCLGEGEETLAELVERLQNNQDYSDVANLCFLREGQMIRNPVRPLLRDIDQLPWLDYGPEEHFIRDVFTDELVMFNEDYFEKSLAMVPYFKNTSLKSFMYFTTRGCPYSCSYCVNDFYRKMYGPKGFVRKLSVEHVVEELEGIIKAHPCIEEIEFCDDNFALRTVDEIRHFCDLYKARIGLPFQLLISPQNIIEEKIAPLVDAGLVFVETGIQSAAESSGVLYQRSMEENKLLRAADILNKYQGRMAPPCYHLILDNPFEDVNDTLKTFELTLKLPRPFWFKRSSLVAFPGTLVFDQYKKAGIIKDQETEIYMKILEMPSTSYINFLFLLNNQNYHKGLLKILSKPGVVSLFNRDVWIPFFNAVEICIRQASRIAKLMKMVLRGDLKALRKRASMIGKTLPTVPSSRPPAF